MRPINKFQVGSTVTLYADTDMPTQQHTVQDTYSPYSNARKVLLANSGKYCAYCEAYLPHGALFQTDHVQPKGLKVNGTLKYDHLIYKWSNFLLSCATCNGSGNKGKKDVVLGEVHLPHLNNTFLSLEYKEAGVVSVNPKLTGLSKQHAEKLIELVGLDKPTSETDGRCDMRRHAWDMAQMFLKQYEANECSLTGLINYIKTGCCWSIWYTVFKNHDEVRKALLDFPGTAKNCFDPNNHYEPINRNPNQPDPV